MTFDDLPLYDAVYAVRKAMEAAGENPGSDDWTADEQKRRELTGRIVAALTTDTEQRMIDAFIGFRKSPNVDGKKKIELIMDVRRAHGDQRPGSPRSSFLPLSFFRPFALSCSPSADNHRLLKC